MLLVGHIILALSAVILMMAGVVYRWLGKDRHALLVRFSSLTFGGAFITGTLLVIKYHAPLVSACLTGLLYFGILTSIYLVYRKVSYQSK